MNMIVLKEKRIVASLGLGAGQLVSERVFNSDDPGSNRADIEIIFCNSVLYDQIRK